MKNKAEEEGKQDWTLEYEPTPYIFPNSKSWMLKFSCGALNAKLFDL